VDSFTGYLYPGYVVNYCKDVILKRLYNKLPAYSKFDVIFLKEWELHNGSEWIINFDYEMSDSKENTLNAEDFMYLNFAMMVSGMGITAIFFVLSRRWCFFFAFLLLFFFFEFLFWVPGSFLPAPVSFINLVP